MQTRRRVWLLQTITFVRTVDPRAQQAPPPAMLLPASGTAQTLTGLVLAT